MTLPVQNTLDDYYAQPRPQSPEVSGGITKSPVKLKIKPKKVESNESSESHSHTEVQTSDDQKHENNQPQWARLVKREHASKWLLLSAMHTAKPEKTKIQNDTLTPPVHRPTISFEKAKPQIFENRPVVPLPRGDRRQWWDHRRDSVKRHEEHVARVEGTRLMDDSKPIFKRDIWYDTPKRDGSTKHGKPIEVRNRRERRSEKSEKEQKGFRRGQVSGKKQEKSVEDIKQILVDRTGQTVSIGDMISVKEFSDKIGVPLPEIMAEMMKNWMLVSLNTPIDYETCYLIAETFGIHIIKEVSKNISIIDLMNQDVTELMKEDDTSVLQDRPPIISIMGHVDHGKTSILDYIRKTQVVAGEAWGITQSIGAYQVERKGRSITFLDTPWHEAFTIMRARGAKLTDIAVIVIAADEGMKPQTIESINHAKEAQVPIIVAMNKMDKPWANPELIKWQLAEQSLHVEEWGGNTIIVPVSAHTGLWIETLLDMILLSADMLELKANPNRPWVATVIESHLDQKLGPVINILVNTGTIHRGDAVVIAGTAWRVRTLKDFRWKSIDEVWPGMPAQITWLSSIVEGGDILQSMSSLEVAQTRAREFSLAKGRKSIHSFEWASLGMLMSRLKSWALKQLKIVLKSDSVGSLEALKSSLIKLSTLETQVTFIHAAVGDVNQSDVMMAGSSQALLISYNVGVVPSAKSMLASSKIEHIDKKVIYHILEKVESIVTGMIDIHYDATDIGVATVKAIFYTGKNHSMMIIGLGITSGKVENKSKVRVIRSGEKIGSGEVVNLKVWPLDVHEVESWQDCGINFKGDITVLQGDILEFFKMVQRK